ncbi:MAG: 30S ribosome-binding factor RbfA [Paenibacillaceae bacterium]|nr:30S ribosome-binding factor RbfA [Paenibacillaceae bacterium]
MSKVRVRRVGEQIKKELSTIVQTEMRDSLEHITTVTDVEMSADLAQAKVYLSIMGNDQQRAQTLQAIGRASGFLRTEIGKRVRLRHVPELLFLLDTSLDYGSHIDAILRTINQKVE